MKEVSRIQHYKAEQFRHSEAQEIKDFLIGTDFYIEPSNYGTRGTLYFVNLNGDSMIRGLVFEGDWLLLREEDGEIEIVRRLEFAREFPEGGKMKIQAKDLNGHHIGLDILVEVNRHWNPDRKQWEGGDNEYKTITMITHKSNGDVRVRAGDDWLYEEDTEVDIRDA